LGALALLGSLAHANVDFPLKCAEGRVEPAKAGVMIKPKQPRGGGRAPRQTKRPREAAA
jgi:hypothetical protein